MPKAESLPPFPDRLSYAALVQDVYDLYAPLAEEQGSLLALQLPRRSRDRPTPRRLWQSPAVVFRQFQTWWKMPLPMLSLRLRLCGWKLFLAAREEAGQRLWCLGVRDNGTGMAEAARRRALQGFSFEVRAAGAQKFLPVKKSLLLRCLS